jgi:hypothetical protein
MQLPVNREFYLTSAVKKSECAGSGRHTARYPLRIAVTPRTHLRQRRNSNMGAAVWKGLVRFGLIAIPVKLYRTAKAEKISFRHLYKSTGARIRQQLYTDTESEVPIPPNDIAPGVPISTAKLKPSSHGRTLLLHRPAEPVPRALSRDDVAKGYQYNKDQYVSVSREDLAQLVPSTACEMTINEFLQPAEINLTYFDSTFYVVRTAVATKLRCAVSGIGPHRAGRSGANHVTQPRVGRDSKGLWLQDDRADTLL